MSMKPPSDTRYSQLARRALDTVMLAKVKPLTAFNALCRLYHERMAQDIIERPDYYALHMDRAAAVHPEISELWQDALNGQLMPFYHPPDSIDDLNIPADPAEQCFFFILNHLYPW